MPSLQEIVTSLRTVGDVVKVFNLTDSRIIVLRGNAKQIALAKFFLTELDQPAQTRPSPAVHELKLDDAGGEIAVVYGLAHTDTPVAMQSLITTLRAVGDIRKIFSVNEPKLLAMRGTSEEMRMAEWLISELDRKTGKSGGNEARAPGGDDDVLHVFYLAHLNEPAGVQALLKSLRSTARISKIFYQGEPAAIALRGTADQVAMAGRMIAMNDAARQ